MDWAFHQPLLALYLVLAHFGSDEYAYRVPNPVRNLSTLGKGTEHPR